MRDSDPYIKTIYSKGGCYRLFCLLKKIWPDAIPVINADANHVGSLIDGVVYDISGIAKWSYRGMDSDDVLTASKWSFSNNTMLQVGECPVCDEPIVV